MNVIRGQGRLRRANAWPVATCTGAFFALLLYGLPQAISWAEWQRPLMWFEFWRIVTSHFTHFSFEHFAYDWIVFVALGLACERRWPKRTRWALAVSILTIPCAVYFSAPELTSYRGLSGLDSTLVLLLAFGLASESGYEHRSWKILPWLISLALLGKVAFEYQSASTLFVSSEALFVPVPTAHLIGGLVGGLASFKSSVDQISAPSMSP